MPKYLGCERVKVPVEGGYKRMLKTFLFIWMDTVDWPAKLPVFHVQPINNPQARPGH